MYRLGISLVLLLWSSLSSAYLITPAGNFYNYTSNNYSITIFTSIDTEKNSFCLWTTKDNKVITHCWDEENTTVGYYTKGGKDYNTAFDASIFEEGFCFHGVTKGCPNIVIIKDKLKEGWRP